jgi:hypothetical protein
LRVTFAGYRFNIDALLARIVYRWHARLVLALVALIACVGIASGLIPPFWRGAAVLAVQTAPEARITVDGRAWPYQVYAGMHTVMAQIPDGRMSWANVTLAAGEPLTITLPSGLGEPRTQLLAPAAPDLKIDRVWQADGGWRVLNMPAREAVAEGEDVTLSELLPYTGQTVMLRAGGAERLSTLDAYAGLADQVHIGGALIEAVYVPNEQAGRGSAPAGIVDVRGWRTETMPITMSAPLTLVRFSPPGDALLLVEQAAAGEQVSLVQASGERTMLVALPGHITRVSWHDDGRAVVLHSRQGEHLTLTLIRLRPTVVTAVLADVDAAVHAGDIVPLAWDENALLWVAPGEHGTATLWRMSLARPVAEQVMPLDARALAVLPDGDVRVLAAQGEQLVVGRYRGRQFFGEAVVSGVPLADDLMGMWQGEQLLIQGGGRVWLLDFGVVEEKE